MDADAREAFKIGFFFRCVEEGLTKEAVAARLEKVAGFEKEANPALLLAASQALPYAAKGLSALGSGLYNAALLPPTIGLVGGAGLGYGLAKMTEPDVNPDQVRAQEIADTYKLYAQRAAAKRKLKSYRPAF